MDERNVAEVRIVYEQPHEPESFPAKTEKGRPMPFLFMHMTREGVTVRGMGTDKDVAVMIDMFFSRHKEVLKEMLKIKLEEHGKRGGDN